MNQPVPVVPAPSSSPPTSGSLPPVVATYANPPLVSHPPLNPLKVSSLLMVAGVVGVGAALSMHHMSGREGDLVLEPLPESTTGAVAATPLRQRVPVLALVEAPGQPAPGATATVAQGVDASRGGEPIWARSLSGRGFGQVTAVSPVASPVQATTLDQGVEGTVRLEPWSAVLPTLMQAPQPGAAIAITPPTLPMPTAELPRMTPALPPDVMPPEVIPPPPPPGSVIADVATLPPEFAVERGRSPDRPTAVSEPSRSEPVTWVEPDLQIADANLESIQIAPASSELLRLSVASTESQAVPGQQLRD